MQTNVKLCSQGPDVIAELDDEIESLNANIEYIHENLADCQTSIMQMEEAKVSICILKKSSDKIALM